MASAKPVPASTGYGVRPPLSGATSVGAVEDAARTLVGRVRLTRVRRLPRGLLVKCENEQLTGSFKSRGAANALLHLRPERVVVGSSGNHGIAVSHIARSLGVPVTVVMAEDSLTEKQDLISALGARVVTSSRGTEARAALVAEVAASEDATIIPSYDHPLVIAGQGTIGLELLSQVPELDVVVVPVGGGGLISGVALAVKSRNPHIRVIGVEPVAADDVRRSLDAGRRVTIPPPETVCDGARAQTPGALTFPIIQRFVDDIVTVPDDEVLSAVKALSDFGINAEPTGALAFAGAAALSGHRVAAIISGASLRSRMSDLTLYAEPQARA